MRFVLNPVAELTLSLPDQDRLRTQIAVRWRRIVHRSILLLLVSGAINFLRSMPLHRGDAFYHAVFGAKIVIVILFFLAAASMVSPSPRFKWLRENYRNVLFFEVVMSLVILMLSGILKIRSQATGSPDRLAVPIKQPMASYNAKRNGNT